MASEERDIVTRLERRDDAWSLRMMKDGHIIKLAGSTRLFRLLDDIIESKDIGDDGPWRGWGTTAEWLGTPAWGVDQFIYEERE